MYLYNVLVNTCTCIHNYWNKVTCTCTYMYSTYIVYSSTCILMEKTHLFDTTERFDIVYIQCTYVYMYVHCTLYTCMCDRTKPCSSIHVYSIQYTCVSEPNCMPSTYMYIIIHTGIYTCTCIYIVENTLFLFVLDYGQSVCQPLDMHSNMWLGLGGLSMYIHVCMYVRTST